MKMSDITFEDSVQYRFAQLAQTNLVMAVHAPHLMEDLRSYEDRLQVARRVARLARFVEAGLALGVFSAEVACALSPYDIEHVFKDGVPTSDSVGEMLPGITARLTSIARRCLGDSVYEGQGECVAGGCRNPATCTLEQRCIMSAE